MQKNHIKLVMISAAVLVVVTLGKVNEGVLQEGLHIKAPFVQQVVKIDNRIVKLEVGTEAFSKPH